MIIYDCESYPNFFSLGAESMDRDDYFDWEISTRRNDIRSLYEWLVYLRDNHIPMIGFNNVGYDYQLIHEIMTDPFNITAARLFEITTRIINSQNQFEHTIPIFKRIIPQIDLYKIHHFDNIAKRTGLKFLQGNMRAESVEDLPIAPGTVMTEQDMDVTLLYGRHDVKETKRFAHFSRHLIDFRRDLQNELDGDVMNFNDAKIGIKMIEKELGKDRCYVKNPATGRSEPRQTIRGEIDLNEIIFPYIKFHTSEFNRILQYLKSQKIMSTKGVFNDLVAHYNGLSYHFGTGGMHASVERKVIHSDDYYVIKDVDVTSQYPLIAIVNRLYPEHLGERFVDVYASIRDKRLTYKKGTMENQSLKLALNAAYGKSNEVHSWMFDPKYTMSITINGQLLICMLAELLMFIPGVEIIQVNTDGVTILCPRHMEEQFNKTCKEWEQYTLLNLEFANYKSMFIRDVNNYIAVYMDGKTKRKGAYVFHEEWKDYDAWWHKSYNQIAVRKAAFDAMVNGIPPEISLFANKDMFDFMIMYKARGQDLLYLGERQQQKTLRFYVANDGEKLIKRSPPAAGGIIGQYKRRNGVSQFHYDTIMQSLPPGTWDPRIHTKNKSVYKTRETSIIAGWNICECNHIDNFDWSNVNYNYYIEQAKDLIIT